VTLALPARGALRGDFEVGGRVPPGRPTLQLVVDGDLAAARTVRPEADGRWRATVDTAAMIDPALRHRVVAWLPGREGEADGSAAQEFRVERAWALAATLADPAGDDHGPPRGDGTPRRYVYPTDASFAPRQMDLRGVRAHTAGGALRLELSMGALTRTWSPANGFDHVAFTVFVELPGAPGGATVMPLQNGTLPGGMRWHRRLRVHGWSNALFSDEGAGPQAEGTPVAPAATLRVDAAKRSLTLTLPAAALGGARSLGGARVYVTTWDYDGGYRELVPAPQGWAVGGGDPATDPRVMDEAGPITLR
jgi:hypothetical protein